MIAYDWMRTDQAAMDSFSELKVSSNSMVQHQISCVAKKNDPTSELSMLLAVEPCHMQKIISYPKECQCPIIIMKVNTPTRWFYECEHEKNHKWDHASHINQMKLVSEGKITNKELQ